MSTTLDIHPSYLKLIRQFPLRPIRDKSQYNRASQVLDKLAVREDADLDSGENDYLETLSILIEEYDREHYPMPRANSTPLEILKFLMEQQNMTVTDLGNLISSKGTASDILHGKRQLSKTHILKLAERFRVDPGLFLK